MLRSTSNNGDGVESARLAVSAQGEFGAGVSRDLLLIDWDGGCVADTLRWRRSIAYRAAELLWPELGERIHNASNSIAKATKEQKTSWLDNKMEAISAALHEDTSELSATAQHVLAVRLLLEEQELDNGQSPGTGKYGSFYHPRQPDQHARHPNKNDSNSGSRPLTVGEITLNWRELLLDTLPIKYRVSPLELEKAVDQAKEKTIISEQFSGLPAINTPIMELLGRLASCQVLVGNTAGPASRAVVPIVTVRHENDVELVKGLLVGHMNESQKPIQVERAQTVEQVVDATDSHRIFVLKKTTTTISDLMRKSKEMKRNSPIDSIHVVESSWGALQDEILHLKHPVIADDDMKLSLFGWTSSPEMERRSTMCPWSSPCSSAEELGEKLSLEPAGFE